MDRKTEASILCKMFGINKQPRNFSALFMRHGSLRQENLLGQSKTTSSTTLDAMEILHTITLNPM